LLFVSLAGVFDSAHAQRVCPPPSASSPDAPVPFCALATKPAYDPDSPLVRLPTSIYRDVYDGRLAIEATIDTAGHIILGSTTG
jgi:hypothetical protein